MVQQAQTYFQAAVWAALLNAAAVAAFVLFMVLTSVHGWPIRALLGSSHPAAAASPASFTSPSAGQIRGGALFGVRGFGAPGAATTPAGGPQRPGGTKFDGPGGGGAAGGFGPGKSDPNGAGSGSPVAGSGSSGVAGSPAAPGAPTLPSTVGPSIDGVGSTVSSAPSIVEGTVDSTVGAANTQLGGALSSSGVSGALQSGAGALLGQGSLVGQTAPKAVGAIKGLPGN